MARKINRKEFLTWGADSAAALALGAAVASKAIASPPPLPVPARLDNVRVGLIGVGSRGTSHVANLLGIEGCAITAVCDLVQSRVKRAQKLAVDAGQSEPRGYYSGPEAYRQLCRRIDVDVAYISTPWELHVPMAVEAMNNGKHAYVEVPAATTLDGCWELVETSEKTGSHCVMMENCCYGQAELTVLNMVRRGLLGEPVNAECGYLHDCRALSFGRDAWYLQDTIERNGNLYPTHGLGPVSEYIGINHGDRFDYLVSMSSRNGGLNQYAAEAFGADDPRAGLQYKCGDVSSSLIRTKSGITILVVYDSNLPRPYSRKNMIQGTKGIFAGYPDRVYIEHRSEPDTWQPLSDYLADYEHPLWKLMGRQALGGGHGGMDYLMNYRFIDSLLKGRYPDMDVYDAAAWSAVGPLSEQSVAGEGKPVACPGFTRGKWKTNKPIFMVDI